MSKLFGIQTSEEARHSYAKILHNSKRIDALAINEKQISNAIILMNNQLSVQNKTLISTQSYKSLWNQTRLYKCRPLLITKLGLLTFLRFCRYKLECDSNLKHQIIKNKQ